jgi:hypothetical protein
VTFFCQSRLKVYTSEVTGLQPYLSSEPFDPTVATLTLHQQDWVPRQLQDTPDTTALIGISAFGGFWTFINGTFTLLFGANVLYFAFGKFPG